MLRTVTGVESYRGYMDFFDLFMPRATHQQRDASGISLSKNGWRRRRKRKNEKQEKNGRVAPACNEHIMF